MRGLLEGTDVMSTKDALVALGVEINRDNDGIWHIVGVGLNSMISPVAPLDTWQFRDGSAPFNGGCCRSENHCNLLR